jgi:hypothetical protein
MAQSSGPLLMMMANLTKFALKDSTYLPIYLCCSVNRHTSRSRIESAMASASTKTQHHSHGTVAKASSPSSMMPTPLSQSFVPGTLSSLHCSTRNSCRKLNRYGYPQLQSLSWTKASPLVASPPRSPRVSVDQMASPSRRSWQCGHSNDGL